MECTSDVLSLLRLVKNDFRRSQENRFSALYFIKKARNPIITRLNEKEAALFIKERAAHSLLKLKKLLTQFQCLNDRSISLDINLLQIVQKLATFTD